MSEDKYRTLRAKLDVFHAWPQAYVFKFIVPREKRGEIEELFAGADYSTRESSSGKYVSLTCAREMASSDAVIEVYERVDRIAGSFAL